MKSLLKKPALLAFALLLPTLSAQSAVVSGYLLVTDLDTSETLGYVGSTTNASGGFTVTTDLSNRLLVSFDDSAESISISAPGSNFPSHGFLGGIVGLSSTSNDLATGSYNYAYLGAVDPIADGAPPSSGGNSFTDATGIARAIESSVWSIHEGNLWPHWVNEAPFTPEPSLMFMDDTLLMTGDTDAFTSQFGPAQNVGLTFVPVPEPSILTLGWLALVGGCGVVRRRR